MALRSSLIRFTLATAGTGFAAAALAQATPATPASPATPNAPSRMVVEAAFTKADANGDGKVTRDEAAKMPEIAGKFATLDRDKSGALSLAEFAMGYRAG